MPERKKQDEKKPRPRREREKLTPEEEQRRRARRFVWRDEDIVWLVPPGQVTRERGGE